VTELEVEHESMSIYGLRLLDRYNETALLRSSARHGLAISADLVRAGELLAATDILVVVDKATRAHSHLVYKYSDTGMYAPA
jgi:hypothetical protein